MRLEPVELSLAHFSLSQLVGLRATTKQAILSETHLTYWNKPSTRANLTFQALEPRGHHLPGSLPQLISRVELGTQSS